jgi:putative transposase
MPDHIHGIIGIIQSPNNNAVRTRHVVSQQGEIQNRESHPVAQIEKTQNRESYPLAQQTNQFGKTIAGSLSAIIGQYKSTLTRWSRKNGYENFAWQGRFHDHIIRNDGAFRRISYYIKNNPTNWNKKKFTQ